MINAAAMLLFCMLFLLLAMITFYAFIKAFHEYMNDRANRGNLIRMLLIAGVFLAIMKMGSNYLSAM